MREVKEPRRLEQHYSVKEAAKRLGVPENTLRTWISLGIMPRVKMPWKKGRVLLRESDLVRMVERYREPAVSEIVDRLRTGGL